MGSRIQPKPLTALAQRQIDKLKISIKGLERQVSGLQTQLEADRRALRNILEEHGAATDQ
jgi:chaperonin cofactor prefoldin